MGVTSTRAPAREWGTGSERRSFWPSLGEILSYSWSLAKLLPLPPWVHQSVPPSPLPSSCMQRRWWGEMKKLCDKHNHFTQEADDAEKERARMSNWVLDLMDQRADMERELCQMELEIRRKKGELAQLKARKREWEDSGLDCLVVTSSFSGQQSLGASAEPGTPKKKKKSKQMPMRHPGLPSQEEQEYYK